MSLPLEDNYYEAVIDLMDEDTIRGMRYGFIISGLISGRHHYYRFCFYSQ